MRGMLTGLMVGCLILATQITTEAQSNVATGQINGLVSDESGAPMPGATVQVTNTETGLRRSTVTGDNGLYRVSLLPSGIYDLRVDLTGFNVEIIKGLRVTLGSLVTIDVSMASSAVEEEIIVTAEAPVVETTNPSVTSSVSDTAIANLPLNGRDLMDLIALTPGSASGSVDEVDGGRGSVNINGMRGIQNSINIDGSSSQPSFFGEERGGSRPPFSFSQAAIKELQVLSSSYNVQLGNASGGIINAITRSGTNDLQGEIFYFHRPESWVSDYADGRPSESYKRQQAGLTLGGPITRDKVHYFLAYDGQRLDQPRLRAWRGFPQDRVADWEARTGLDYDQETNGNDETTDGDTILARLDWQLSSNHLVTVRDSYNEYEGVNGTTKPAYRTTTWSNNGLEKSRFNSFVASLSSVLSDSALNELIFQHAYEDRPRQANSTLIPEARIGSGYDAAFGQSSFLPNDLDEERVQIADSFTYHMGDHSLKAGVNIEMVSFDGVLFRYGGGHYYFRSWDHFFNGEPRRYIQSFSESGGRVELDTDYYGLYLQDEWRASPDLTLTYGLRYDYQRHDDPPDTNPGFPATGEIANDDDNLAPRVGFAWDVKGDGKQVLRGGIGYFYDSTPVLLDANAMLTNGVRVVRVEQSCESGDLCPTWPDVFASLGDLPSPRPDIFVFSSDFENPETLRLSLGYEREIFTDLSIGVDLIYSETKNLERRWDINLAPDGGTTIDGRPTYDRAANYDDLNQIMQFTSDAEAEYRALILKARKRFSNGWMLDASYTYAKAEDNDSNERSVSSSSSYPEDQLDLDAEWGPSNLDIRHKLVASATVQLPFDISLSTIINIRSGFPYTAGDSRDLNRDGYYNDRATVEVEPGVYYHHPRNGERQPWRRTVDMRLAKTFRLIGDTELELIAEVFNLFDNDNFITTNRELIEEQWWAGGAIVVRDDFGEKDVSGDPRQLQLGLKLRF